ncbi:E3 ubiquitin-protein ligase hel2 [Cladorrhinum samala]|uniref:RING-type E3 ubiquitin transferase n=1 Tax=Cladorrhinum samala TaxID=585594 RepID=A0AAV9HSJ4_9PEZI|nr:E3 ubiquitin-protein ligase hel2 [Cladorrhinum samala]
MASSGAAALSSEIHAAPAGPRGEGSRGRGRGRGGRGGGRGRGDHPSRGRGGRGGRGGDAGGANPQHAERNEAKPPQPSTLPNFKKTADAQQDGNANEEAEVCFICASPITHYSIAPCNHITCHLCALRLRALYKNKDCPHCRTASQFVIFTDDGTKRYEEYTPSDITSTDDNIGIRYAGEDIVGDTILLLRYNCPDSECDFAGLGWPDLHRHVRSTHNKKMCDLCTRNKKVFTHEHDMFADKELTEHMRHGDDKPGAADQTGFRGHPLCGFCGARFYDSDKLYEHCRNKHERCFLCDRRDSRQPHYYVDYNALEEHFKKDHFICNDRECLEKKFVVFESEMDLKAHQLAEHGGASASRGARTVDLSNFDLRQRYEQERAGGAGRGRAHQERRRAPDPSNEPLPVSSAQPLRRDELAFQRQMAIQTSRTAPASAPGPSRTPAATSQPSRAVSNQPIIDAMESLSITDLSSLRPEQRASLTRHGAVIERASNLLGNDPNKLTNFRSYISSFNKNSMTPDQVIEAFSSLFTETSATALGTLVREVADLFEDKKKGDALRKSWQNRRANANNSAEVEDYPSLPTLGGMRGATTSTSGWASAAQASSTVAARSSVESSRNSNRVLKLKNSTRRGSNASSLGGMSFASVSGSGRAGNNSSSSTSAANAFPALPGSGSGSTSRNAGASWIGGSSASTPSSVAPRPPPAPGKRTGTGKGGAGGEDAFPALPAAPKPQTTIFGYGSGAVRRDFGGPKSTGFSWGGSGSGSASGGGSGSGGVGQGQQQHEEEKEQAGSGGGKKKNKKQVLAHWG